MTQLGWREIFKRDLGPYMDDAFDEAIQDLVVEKLAGEIERHHNNLASKIAQLRRTDRDDSGSDNRCLDSYGAFEGRLVVTPIALRNLRARLEALGWPTWPAMGRGGHQDSRQEPSARPGAAPGQR